MKNLIVLTTLFCLSLLSTTLFAQSAGTMENPKPCAQLERMPCDQMNDPQMTSQMLTLLKASDNSAWQGEILKVVVMDKEWFVQRDCGEIIARYIHAQVAVRRDGKCWLYHLVTFKQDYLNGQFSNMAWYNHGDYSHIPCENIK